MSGASSLTNPPRATLDRGADQTSSELKRGMSLNAIALVASNFRGVFTFLIARLLGPAALGTFSVGWATTDILTNLGTFGLEDTITTFIARAQINREPGRARALARIAIFLAVVQCSLLAVIAIALISLLGPRFGLDQRMANATCLLLAAMPGVALYRVGTAVSRGMKVMQHDIFSRGLTEPIATTAAFLLLFSLGYVGFAPQFAAIIGTGISGIVALVLALSLFREIRSASGAFSFPEEARRLLGYGAHITSYGLLNSLIVRLDVLMLACFIGKAPGVTLPTVGVYAAVVEVAGGLRKANQIFNPIFAPVMAGLTVAGDQQSAVAAFSRIAQWMLWILLPALGAIGFAGSTMLSIYGPAFRQGATWLNVVALACATNCFVSLAETVIMVQKPKLNVINSGVTCVFALIANWWLIKSLGVTGASLGILLPYVLLGILRHRTLEQVFGWPSTWSNLTPPIIAGLIALLPAVGCRMILGGMTGEIVSAAIFLGLFGCGWRWYQRQHPQLPK